MSLFHPRVWALAALLLLLYAPAATLACDTGSDSSSPAAKSKKR
ncbi:MULTISPECIES: hypothetical protein [unclassified Cyanobium]|nr:MULTISPECIES: hypothetical protein [unclassified Cyanobium]